jgi:hypothetical protein
VSAVVPLPGAESDGAGLAGSSAGVEVSDGRTALRDDLVRVFLTLKTESLEVLADYMIDTGWRRVVEDDDTIERLAQAMWFGPPEWTARIVQQEYATTWRAKARAVVRALREETTGD